MLNESVILYYQLITCNSKSGNASVIILVACSRRSHSKQQHDSTGRATGNKARKKRGGFVKSGGKGVLYILNFSNHFNFVLYIGRIKIKQYCI